MPAADGGDHINRIIELTSEVVARKVAEPIQKDLNEIKISQATLGEKVDGLHTAFKEHEGEDDQRFTTINDRLNKKNGNGNGNGGSKAAAFMIENWKWVLVALALCSDAAGHVRMLLK